MNYILTTDKYIIEDITVLNSITTGSYHKVKDGQIKYSSDMKKKN